jgi:hypothetical protein
MATKHVHASGPQYDLTSSGGGDRNHSMTDHAIPLDDPRRLVEDPSSYEGLAAAYDDYLTLHRRFVERGPDGLVADHLK